MNIDKVRLLSDEATQLCNAKSHGAPEPWQWEHQFAELIVREAVATLQKHVLGDHSREDQEVLRCLTDLKRHFGIEE